MARSKCLQIYVIYHYTIFHIPRNAYIFVLRNKNWSTVRLFLQGARLRILYILPLRTHRNLSQQGNINNTLFCSLVDSSIFNCIFLILKIAPGDADSTIYRLILLMELVLVGCVG